MTPERFIESNCLKCHTKWWSWKSEREFPEPAGAEMVKGYELIARTVATVVHESMVSMGRRSESVPTFDLEPNFAEVAGQILSDQGAESHGALPAGKLQARPGLK